MIYIDRVGEIVQGDDVGCEVMVTRATDGSGAYYILISENFSSLTTEKYDSWVETFEDVEEYFNESNWAIEWQ